MSLDYFNIFEKKRCKYNVLLTTIEIVDHSKKQFLQVEEMKEEVNSSDISSDMPLDMMANKINSEISGISKGEEPP